MNFSKPQNAKRIRLLLAEDHTVLRQGLAGLLGQEPDMEVVGEADDGEMAVSLASRVHPDVVLMDMGLPKMDGVETTREIRRASPGVRVIGLSMYEEQEKAEAMLRAGAAFYLRKSGPAEALVKAIRCCARAS